MNRREFVEAIGAATALATAEALAAAPAEFDPLEKSIAELSSAQAQGRASAESLTQGYLRRIERYDRRGPALRAVLAVNPQALEAARALDAERRAGRLRGPLHGIPLLIKDNIETRDPLPTTAGSLALAARGTGRCPGRRAAARRRCGDPRQDKSERMGQLPLHSLGQRLERRRRPDPRPSTRPAIPRAPARGPRQAPPPAVCRRRRLRDRRLDLAPASIDGLVGLKPTVGLVSGVGWSRSPRARTPPDP